MMENFRTYSELIQLPTLEERYQYLKIGGRVGDSTFGFDRYLNQYFYGTDEWRSVRNKIIVRDMGNDLGLPEFPIQGSIYVHHMNPINVKDILNRTDFLFNPDFLICVSLQTHNAIHYGDEKLLPRLFEPRSKYDTCPWKRPS